MKDSDDVGLMTKPPIDRPRSGDIAAARAGDPRQERTGILNRTGQRAGAHSIEGLAATLKGSRCAYRRQCFSSGAGHSPACWKGADLNIEMGHAAGTGNLVHLARWARWLNVGTGGGRAVPAAAPPLTGGAIRRARQDAQGGTVHLGSGFGRQRIGDLGRGFGRGRATTAQVGAADIGDAHPRRSVLHHVQQFGGAARQVNNTPTGIGATVSRPAQ